MGNPGETSGLYSFEESKAQLETDFLARALIQSRFIQKQAASFLGISYDQFRGLYKKHQERLEEYFRKEIGSSGIPG